MPEKKIRIRLIKSTIGTPRKIREVVFALGLRRPNNEVIHNVSPCIMGMVNKTKHMIQVTEV
jgi:large subunit ribosomal protein L30